MKHYLPLLRKNEPYNQVLSILISGFMVCVTVLYSTGAFDYTFIKLSNLIPRFPVIQEFREINDYSSQQDVFSSQPQISYNPNARYLFVEVGDLNCPNCAKFYGYSSNISESSYSRLKEDYIFTGKMNYMFIDSSFLNSLDKHNSIYCVAEQDSKKFFQYKESLYKNFGYISTEFDATKARRYIDKFFFDMNKFEDCLKSKKYQERVKKISEYALNTLQVTATPTFLIFEFEFQDVIKLDGTRSKEKNYVLKGSIVGNQNYDVVMKPEIEKILNS